MGISALPRTTDRPPYPHPTPQGLTTSQRAVEAALWASAVQTPALAQAQGQGRYINNTDVWRAAFFPMDGVNFTSLVLAPEGAE